ncbi:MAG TPA: hypothetical protein VK815_09935 [Candidatus Acidoferrales bacterium]|nr:hypothetical protein [Candidatus Acidoferrales bacterium]
MAVIFVETPTFTKRVLGLLSDDSYGALQRHLAARPDDGDVMRGSGGLRKIRWAAKGHGKRGGVRVIYYWWMGKDRISMLYIYPKNELDDLSAAQLKLLRQALEL